MRYFQCRLKETNGNRETVGWIEERGAKLGASVELKDFGAFFDVLQVSNMSFDLADLQQKQRNDRGCFGSLVAA